MAAAQREPEMFDVRIVDHVRRGNRTPQDPMTKTCQWCGDVLIHMAPGVHCCYRCDLVGRFPLYIEVKGQP